MVVERRVRDGWTSIGRMNRLIAVAVAGAVMTGCAGSAPSADVRTPAAVYRAWVTSEAADEVSLVQFSAEGVRVEKEREVGMMPIEIDGPHGVATSPDGRFIYVSIGHGVPFGSLWKIDTESMDVVGQTPLGLFPATVAVTPDGDFGFISNFNLHGDPVPSSISKVHLGTMSEVARTETCIRPHGSRINPQGTRHYSVCGGDQILVEIDVASGEVNRMFSVVPDVMAGVDPKNLPANSSGSRCSPTWAEPSADGSSVFVTCNAMAEVLEIDVASWTVVRRFSTGEAPYNLAATPDGRFLLVSLRDREDPALEVIELRTGQMAGRVTTTTNLVHGVAVTADSRYAFVSVEGVGAEPGKVDVVDLQAFELAGSVGVGQQATGIAIAP